MKTSTPSVLIAFALVWLALSPQARAVCQEGCDLNNGNTFLGDDALVNNTTGLGQRNTAVGAFALRSNTTGGGNTATGFTALYSNTEGFGNTATGESALTSNTIGIENTANGDNALGYNTTGSYNTATGLSALYHNTTGNFNTAIGNFALVQNTTASSNTATGYGALQLNTTGFRNTANGYQTLANNYTGANNTAEGFQALFNHGGSNNVGLGFQALYHGSGSNNVGLGFQAGLNLITGSNNICIGSGVLGVAGDSNTTRIRNIYASVASGRAVYVNSDNKIGTLVSSRRFKEEIKPMNKASEGILALKPVTFRYKKEIEPNSAIMFGLIAEEVEQVDPDLVTRNDKGEAETVRYDAVNAMLLNEFLKARRQIDAQQKQINALTAGLQKMSAQLEASKPAPQVAENNQ